MQVGIFGLKCYKLLKNNERNHLAGNRWLQMQIVIDPGNKQIFVRLISTRNIIRLLLML